MKVYKYRCTKDSKILERDINTFSNNKFFAPTFKTFEDKLEASFKDRISIIIDILGEKISEKIKKIKTNLKEIVVFKDKIGIYCVTKRYDNKHMWGKYANENKGYCIEYDLEKLTDKSKNIDFSHILNVKYDNTTPILNTNDINSNSLISKMFGIKRTKYSPEEEIRLIFNFDSLKNHHKSAITAIYFGLKTEEKLIQKFYDKFTNRNVKFYRMKTNENCELKREMINEFSRNLIYDIDKYNFRILKHIINEHIEIYHVHVIGNINLEAIKEFAFAFNEKNCFKLCNLHIYNNSEIVDLIEVYPLPDSDYVRFADSYIANADFSSETIFFEFPFKDFKYNNLKNK